MNFDFSALTQNAGQYYNSVTDSYQDVPVGATSYGNGGSKEVNSIWHSIGDGVGAGVDYVKDIVGDSVEGITGFAEDKIGGLFQTLREHAIIMIGVALVVIVVIAKSGVLTQSADLTRAVYGG